MQLKKQSKMLLMFLWVLLSGCVSAPPDFLACANMGDEGYCRTYVSKKKVEIDNELKVYKSKKRVMVWDEVVATSVLIPADQFVLLKNFFDNYCHQNNGACPSGLGDWQGFANDLGAHIKVNP